MRQTTVSPNNQKRVALMAESAIKTYSPVVAGSPFYVGMFSDAVRQRGLHEQKRIAINTIKNILKTERPYFEKIQVVECLMIFSYLCGWNGADSVFQKTLEKMQLKASLPA